MENFSETKLEYYKICVILISLVILRICFLYMWKPIIYWKKRNIYYVNPWLRFFQVYFNKKSFIENIIDAYRYHPTKRYYGSAMFMQPSLFIRDLDLIKQVTIKDFDYFPNHPSLISAKTDPVLTLNLFSLEGDKWKDMRSTLSPAFTSSKMKTMFVLIQENAQNFVQYFCKNSEELIELDIKTAYSKYSNDIITSCALGIQCDSLRDDTNIFYTMGSKINSQDISRVLRGILAGFFPKVFEFFRIPVVPTSISHFFKTLIKETITIRERKHISRPDMIHLLLEAKKGRLLHETDTIKEYDVDFATVEESSYGKNQKKLEITEDLMAAQALIFFIAGFETSSTTLSFLSYHLSIDQNIQSKLRKEIDAVVKNTNTNENITYQELLKMKYLDQVISETLRMYPPGYVLTRVCTKKYVLPAKTRNEVDLTIDPGIIIMIPVIGVHMDPEYFPNPKKFDPERFSEINKVNIIPGTFMPFGSGPRNCIGSRFALLEIKAIIVHLLIHFEIVPTKKTRIPIKLSKTVNLGAKDGFWLGLKKR